MNEKELLKQGIRRGIPLWRIEEELDWREDQDRRQASREQLEVLRDANDPQGRQKAEVTNHESRGN